MTYHCYFWTKDSQVDPELNTPRKCVVCNLEVIHMVVHCKLNWLFVRCFGLMSNGGMGRVKTKVKVYWIFSLSTELICVLRLSCMLYVVCHQFLSWCFVCLNTYRYWLLIEWDDMRLGVCIGMSDWRGVCFFMQIWGSIWVNSLRLNDNKVTFVFWWLLMCRLMVGYEGDWRVVHSK